MLPAASLEPTGRSPSRGRSAGLIALAFFSVCYFAETAIRASEKRFWYDELCTLYICRLPQLSDSWAAVLHGADYNPPLFYLVHRVVAAVFGDGELAFRIPEIFAFYVLCLCLYFLVAPRLGIAAGFVAMCFPVLSGAYYYAYEARPHGIVLGFCGLAVLAWSRWMAEPRQLRWLLVFAASLSAAMLLHCYAVLFVLPFGIFEAVRCWRTRRFDWLIAASLIVPVLFALLSLVPLLRAYRENIGRAGFSLTFAPSAAQFPLFYVALLTPCILVVLAFIVLLAIGSHASAPGRVQRFGRETWLAVLLIGMPAYGVALAKFVHGPFFGRYFLSAAIGVSLLLAIAISNIRTRVSAPAFLAAFAGALLLLSSMKTVAHRIYGRSEDMLEPSVHYLLNADLRDSLATNPLLRTAPTGLAVAATNMLDYFYLRHYWQDAPTRLFHVVPSRNTVDYLTSHPALVWCRLPNASSQTTEEEFFKSHHRFLLYAESGQFPMLSKLIAEGARVSALRFDGMGHLLADVQLADRH